MRVSKIVFISVLILSVVGCKKKNKEEEAKADFNRNALLENIGENIIVKRYEALNSAVNTLHNTVSGLSTPLTATQLTSIQSQFEMAYVKWQGCSPFEFGPAATHIIKATVNTYPVDTTQINTNISNGNYNLGTASNVAAIGFPAIDFLLYNQSANTLNYLNNPTNGVARLTYLKDVVSSIKTAVNSTTQDWKNTYITTFKNANGTDVGSSVGLMVNALNQDFEKYIRDGKVGIPVGVRSLGTALPEKSEALYSQQSLVLLKESIVKLQAFFNGNGETTGTNGFDDYLDHLETKHGSINLSIKINQQFDAIIQKTDALNNAISIEVVNNQANVQLLYDELQKMVVLLKVDLASALSVLITYQDNDGD